MVDLRTARLRRLVLWGPVVAYMAMIFLVSALPSAPLPEEVSDKSAHLWGYAVLAALSVRAVAGGLPCRVTVPVGVMAMVIASGYGAFDEWHQSLVAGRLSEAADWIADTAGALVGIGACWAWGMMAARSDV